VILIPISTRTDYTHDSCTSVYRLQSTRKFPKNPIQNPIPRASSKSLPRSTADAPARTQKGPTRPRHIEVFETFARRIPTAARPKPNTDPNRTSPPPPQHNPPLVFPSSPHADHSLPHRRRRRRRRRLLIPTTASIHRSR